MINGQPHYRLINVHKGSFYMIQISVAFNLLLLVLDILMLYFPSMFLSFSPSFCSAYRRQRAKSSDCEFDSCAIPAYVALLREGSCTSSISVAGWITAADDWNGWFTG